MDCRRIKRILLVNVFMNCIFVSLQNKKEVLLDILSGEESGWVTWPDEGWKIVQKVVNGSILYIYSVCNMTGQQDNWLRSKLIQRHPTATRMFIEILFVVHDFFLNGDTCKENFNLYTLEVDADIGTSFHKSQFRKAATIASNEISRPRERGFKTETVVVEYLSRKGFYLAFQDVGACVDIYSVRVYYKTCPTTVKHLTTFPETVAGGGNQALREVAGACVENAESEDQPRIYCTVDGEWVASVGQCQCRRGYEAVDNKCQADLCLKDVINVGSTAHFIFFAIVVICSLIGNTVVLMILGFYETLKSLTNMSILNFVLSDLMFTLFVTFYACSRVWGWTFGEVMCKVFGFIFYAWFYNSIMFLMVMSFQHYTAVVHNVSDWDRGLQLVVIPVLVWLVSISAALPVLSQSKVISYSERLYCEYTGNTYRWNIFFLCGFWFILFCFIRILQTIFKSQTNHKHKSLKLTFYISAVFFIGWAPYNVIILMMSTPYHTFNECQFRIHLQYAFYVCQLLAYCYCCIKPVCYFLFDIKLRNHLKLILQNFRRRRKSPQMSSTEVLSDEECV